MNSTDAIALHTVVDMLVLGERSCQPASSRSTALAAAGQSNRLTLAGVDYALGLTGSHEGLRSQMREAALGSRVIEAFGEMSAAYQQRKEGKIGGLEVIEAGVSSVSGVLKAYNAFRVSRLKASGADPALLAQAQQDEAEAACYEMIAKGRLFSRLADSVEQARSPQPAPAAPVPAPAPQGPQISVAMPFPAPIPNGLEDAVPELENYRDPVTLELPVYPCRIHGEPAVYDVSTLRHLLEQGRGTARSPMTRQTFTAANVEGMPRVQQEVQRWVLVAHLMADQRCPLAAQAEYDSWNGSGNGPGA